MTIARQLQASAGLLVAGLCTLILGAHPTTAAQPAAGPDAARSTPVILSVDPSSPAPRSAAQRVTITGEDFLPGLTFAVTGPDGQTTVHQGGDILSRTDTSFAVMLMLAVEGTYTFKVTNTDGGVSEPFTVEVQKAASDPPAPVISGVTPSEPEHQPEPQVLRVSGQHFERGLRAIVTNPIGEEIVDVTVGRITPTSFELTVLLASAGNVELVVSNPSGAVSNVWTITVR